MDRKKQLKEQYKQMKPDMGIFIIRSKSNNKYHLRVTQNLKGVMNSTKFQLNANGYQNEELQNEWTEFGAEKFEIEILEILQYDKDESRTDYSEELDILKIVWDEKLSKQNFDPYKGKK